MSWQSNLHNRGHDEQTEGSKAIVASLTPMNLFLPLIVTLQNAHVCKWRKVSLSIQYSSSACSPSTSSSSPLLSFIFSPTLPLLLHSGEIRCRARTCYAYCDDVVWSSCCTALDAITNEFQLRRKWRASQGHRGGIVPECGFIVDPAFGLWSWNYVAHLSSIYSSIKVLTSHFICSWFTLQSLIYIQPLVMFITSFYISREGISIMMKSPQSCPSKALSYFTEYLSYISLMQVKHTK